MNKFFTLCLLMCWLSGCNENQAITNKSVGQARCNEGCYKNHVYLSCQTTQGYYIPTPLLDDNGKPILCNRVETECSAAQQNSSEQ